MKRSVFLIVLLALAGVAVRPASAQRTAAPPDSGADARDPAAAAEDRVRSPLRPIRIAKWSTLAGSLAAAGYGFAVHDDANGMYRELEEICDADPDRCRDRAPDGSYNDPALEEMYQEVVRLDDRARLALVGSQIALAGSVILFILDLRESETPPNVLYDPPGFRFVPRRGGAAEFRFTLPVGHR